MSKKPILSTEEIIAYIDEYFMKCCDCNANELKIPGISEYICRQGYNIQAYTIRRNEAVKKHINTLIQGAKSQHYNNVVVFKTLDINQFLNKNNSKDQLSKALQERDAYYRDIATSSSVIFKENETLTRTHKKQKQEISELKAQIENLQQKLNDLATENKRLCKEKKSLLDLVDTYVYPEIANELLVKHGILRQGSGVIKADAVEENTIHPDTDVQKIKNNIVKGLFELIE